MNAAAFFKLSYGLYVISSEFEGSQSGLIVNTLLQTSADPQTVCVTISKNSYTMSLIEKSDKFCATVLTQSADIDFIGNFGFNCGKSFDKFDKIDCVIAKNGIKYSKSHAAAMFECTVTSSKDLGTHIMFFADVNEAEIISDEPVMTYAYYHSVVKGSTPKNSPLYTKEDSGKKGYKCSICGHIEEVEELPDGYTCPICKKSKEFFDAL